MIREESPLRLHIAPDTPDIDLAAFILLTISVALSLLIDFLVPDIERLRPLSSITLRYEIKLKKLWI